MKLHRTMTARQEALAERNLFAALAALRGAEECRAFLRDLCTPAELEAMADRCAVVDWLRRGVPYREIQRATGVSVTTIGRVARFLATQGLVKWEHGDNPKKGVPHEKARERAEARAERAAQAAAEPEVVEAPAEAAAEETPAEVETAAEVAEEGAEGAEDQASEAGEEA